SACRNHRHWVGATDAKSGIPCFSLLFAVLFGGSKSRVSIIPGATGGCAELSVARAALQKKYAVNFADKFAVPRISANAAGFRLNPLLLVTSRPARWLCGPGCCEC